MIVVTSNKLFMPHLHTFSLPVLYIPTIKTAGTLKAALRKLKLMSTKRHNHTQYINK